MLFITEDAKEIVLDFWKRTVKVLWFYFLFNIILIWKMTQYNMLNVKLSNSQLNKLKSAIQNGTEVTFIECCWLF